MITLLFYPSVSHTSIDMEYTIQKFAQLSGVTPRALRHYDAIGLLAPKRINSAGYRIYGADEVDRLQQILLFREMGFSLLEIKQIIDSNSFDQSIALQQQLSVLLERKQQLNLLIRNVEKTIQEKEGIRTMHDHEKFEGLKRKQIQENEQQYGKEIRERYGKEAVDQSNAKLMNLTPEEYQEMEQTNQSILKKLEQAVITGKEPSSAVGLEIATLHKKWLSFTWADYSAQAHKGLVQMYVMDERFTQYYDRTVSGCAAFLKAAVESHLSFSQPNTNK